MTWIGLDDKPGVEVMKSRGLEKELDEVKASLLKESDEHDTLRVVILLVCDDLELAPEQVMSSFAVRAIWITDRSCETMRNALCFGINRSFAITCSHYENIDLAMVSQGFIPSYSEAELDEIEESVAPLAQNLSVKIEDEVIPPRG